MPVGRAVDEALRELTASTVKPGLDRIRALLAAVGDPHEGIPAVHIAGTNGKGSVAAMLSAVLRCAGLRVGTYTSPHLVELRERIQLDGACVDEDHLSAAVDALRRGIRNMPDSPSYFEALTAAAFSIFAVEAVDIAVVEVGMGGRFDATNVADACLSVLTNISVDHTDYLGETTEEIAWEKAGIAKAGVPFVLGRELGGTSRAIVEAECARRGAPLRHGTASVATVHGDWSGTTFHVDGSWLAGAVHLPLVGSFQESNLHVAITALEALADAGWDIPSERVGEGLSEVRWPGRAEVIRERPRVLLDAAHNAAGAAALVETVCALEPVQERRSLLLGVLRDKDVDAITRALAPAFPHIIATASSSARALPASDLASCLERIGASVAVSGTVAQGVGAALDRLRPEELLVVSGSVTVVGEARDRLLGGPCDEA